MPLLASCKISVEATSTHQGSGIPLWRQLFATRAFCIHLCLVEGLHKPKKLQLEVDDSYGGLQPAMRIRLNPQHYALGPYFQRSETSPNVLYPKRPAHPCLQAFDGGRLLHVAGLRSLAGGTHRSFQGDRSCGFAACNVTVALNFGKYHMHQDRNNPTIWRKKKEPFFLEMFITYSKKIDQKHSDML